MKPKIYSYTRFSYRLQARGDSTRRQIEATEQWVQREGKGMPLDTSLREPRDVSAFRGYNAKAGSLAKFLQAIADGQVARGSILVVENLDRLSRNEPLEGLDAMRSIINAGVDIVTLHDNQRYTQENMRRDLGKLMSALVILSRAFEESDTKSQRLLEKWGQKREAARKGTPITLRVPAWLKVVGSKRVGSRRDWSEAKCVLVEERAKLVRQIFSWSSDGWGYRRIARELRARKVSTWGRAPWSASMVGKIIKSRAATGEFQPHVYVGGAHGVRKPHGRPVRGYFPRVVTDEQWEQAQAKVTQHRAGPRSAILSGLLIDPQGRRMHYMWTGSKGHKVAYVQTAESQLKSRDVAIRWRAVHLEASVVRIVEGIDWERVYTDRSKVPEIAKLVEGITKLDRSEAVLMERIEKAASAFLGEGAFSDAVRAQAKKHEAELSAVRADRTNLRARLDQLRRTSQAAGTGISTQGLPKNVDERERLNAELRSLLKSVQIWPDGRTGDSFWPHMLEQAMAQTSQRAKVARRTGRVLGAIRFQFANGKAITAYVRYMPRDRKLHNDLIGFANPVGMDLGDWAQICHHAAWRVALDNVTNSVTT